MPRKTQQQRRRAPVIAFQKKKKAKDELTRLGAALRSLGGLGGRALGTMVGYGDAGASAGSGLGAAVSRWLGSGDYTVSANSIVQRAGSGVPMMHKTGQTVTVRHREYLGEVRSSTSFLVRNAFELNPGSRETFPWLSGVAGQFQEYSIKGMVFHYVPSSGSAVASTNNALGTVMLQTSYRATDVQPVSKVEMLNEFWSSESAPMNEFCHPIECDPKENPFNIHYVRTGNVSAAENVLMYDLGRTFLAVSGQQANDVVLGDLWVTYEVELKKPVVLNATSSNIRTALITGTNLQMGYNSVQASTFEGSFALTPGSTGIGFPVGTTGSFLIAITYFGVTSFSQAAPTFLRCSGLNIVAPSVNWSSSNIATGSNGVVYLAVTISEVLAQPAAVMLGATSGPGVTSVRAVITEVNPLNLAV